MAMVCHQPRESTMRMANWQKQIWTFGARAVIIKGIESNAAKNLLLVRAEASRFTDKHRTVVEP